MQRLLNSLFIWTLAAVLLAALGVQFIGKEKPCPLCLLQRLAMMGIGLGASLNLRFFISTTHYAVMLLSLLFGGFVALRQIALHICPGFPTFGQPVLGLSLYTWSFIVFACSCLAIALLLLLFDPKEKQENSPKYAWLSTSAFWAMWIIAIANMVAAFHECGLGLCE